MSDAKSTPPHPLSGSQMQSMSVAHGQWHDKGIRLKADSAAQAVAKRSRTPIAIQTWRDKLTPQAIGCRYLA
jgi:hypothetical protein